MSNRRLIWGMICTLILTGCVTGFRKYTIEEVSHVLYREGLICSTELDLVQYPTGIQAYILHGDNLCLSDHDNEKYGGRIELYPTRSELKRVTRNFAETMRKGPFTYSEFIKGNVVITILPALPEEQAERFRRALQSLE